MTPLDTAARLVELTPATARTGESPQTEWGRVSGCCTPRLTVLGIHRWRQHSFQGNMMLDELVNFCSLQKMRIVMGKIRNVIGAVQIDGGLLRR